MLKSTFPHWSVGVVWPDGAIGITKVSRLHGEGVQKFCQSTGTPVQVFHRELFAEYTRKQFKALNLGADIPRKRRSRSDQVRTPQGA